MPKPIKMITQKTPEGRPSRRLSPQRLNPLPTFYLVFEKWMLVTIRAINCLPKQTNIPRRTFLNRIFPGLRTLELCFLTASRTPSPLKNLEETIKRIKAIKRTVMIPTQSFQALSQPLKPILPIFLLQTIVTKDNKDLS